MFFPYNTIHLAPWFILLIISPLALKSCSLVLWLSLTIVLFLTTTEKHSLESVWWFE